MSNYQTIKYIREAVQLIIGETPPDEIEIAGTMYQVYRDQSGYYIQVPTNRGTKRVTKDQWIVLQSAGDPGVPTIPEVKATGSFTVTDVIATGDGVVGFTYDGITYTDEPTAGDNAGVTARTLSRKINRESGFELVTIVVDNVITISSTLQGTAGNLPIVDVSTDTTQNGTVIGLDDGVDYVPGIPAINPVFQVFTPTEFPLIYEPEVV
jgi:hypothetical protein